MLGNTRSLHMFLQEPQQGDPVQPGDCGAACRGYTGTIHQELPDRFFSLASHGQGQAKKRKEPPQGLERKPELLCRCGGTPCAGVLAWAPSRKASAKQCFLKRYTRIFVCVCGL